MVSQARYMNDDGTALYLPMHRCAAGRYSVDFNLDVTDPDTLELLQNCMLSFVTAGNQGAFPAPGLSPGSVWLRAGVFIQQSPNRFVCELEGENFDMNGFELLRNMVEWLVRRDIDVRRIVVMSADPVDKPRLKPPPTDNTEDAAYPAMSPVLGFEVTRDWIDDGKFRRCLVELSTHIDTSSVDRMVSCVSPWFQLLESGAFSLPVGHAWETDCVAGAVTIFDAHSIEITINRFQASESAWHALVNMIDSYWRNLLLVTKVTIE
ncbi:MAG: hypothetical protein ACXW00_07990 [Methylobacter sp.]